MQTTLMGKLLSFVQQNRTIIAFLSLLLAAFCLLRTKPTEVSSLEGLEAMLGHGQPAILDFYSNA